MKFAPKEPKREDIVARKEKTISEKQSRWDSLVAESNPVQRLAAIQDMAEQHITQRVENKTGMPDCHGRCSGTL